MPPERLIERHQQRQDKMNNLTSIHLSPRDLIEVEASLGRVRVQFHMDSFGGLYAEDEEGNVSFLHRKVRQLKALPTGVGAACDCAFAEPVRDHQLVPEAGLLLVTRHGALRELLGEEGFEFPECLAHAGEDDVRGKHVVGNLPLHLAALAASVTTVTLELTPDMRGRELSVAELRSAFRGVQTYQVMSY